MRTSIRAAFAALFAIMAAAAHGQVLDFDGVCPTPPCAVGSLYAASGVTFSPGNAQVVAAGTNGLTGPNGARYLSITSPYLMTISLARSATWFSVLLSRASTAVGALTVDVTWLKSGTPVFATSIPLTTVDTWVPVDINLPGGFDTVVLDGDALVNATYGIDSVRFGGTCFGFADVSPSDSFCNAAEWLANRNVTLGCAPGQYCPLANVTRAQMALFMQRLGQALSPIVLNSLCSASSTLSPAIRLCEVSHTATQPQIGIASFSCGLQAFSSQKSVFSHLERSVDAGPWVEFGTRAHATGIPGGSATMSQVSTVFLWPNRAYRIAIGLAHAAGDAADSIQQNCSLVVQIHNQNPAQPPYDVDASPPR